MDADRIWNPGDRVRVIQGRSAYTGCRGTVVEAPGTRAGGDPSQLPLGYFVAIDGENGVARPFLAEALERIAAVSSRGRVAEVREAGRD